MSSIFSIGYKDCSCVTNPIKYK